MKTHIVAAFCAALVAFLAFACYRPAYSIPDYEYKQYVLLTWNVRSGDLCFSLMIQADSNEFIHRWFPKANAKCGLADLKRAIADLAKGAFVLWQDWPPKGFDYPDESVIRGLVEFAKAHDVNLRQSHSLQ